MKELRNKKMLSILLVLLLSVSGITAYFTDQFTITNVLTVGNIDIELTEPNWNEDNAKDIVPNKEILKDPMVTNVSKANDAFIFVEVEIPYANIKTAELDGTPNDAAEVEMFSFTLNDGWIEIGTSAKDSTKKVVKHTYAYATPSTMTTLAVGESTTAVFSKVAFANVVDSEVFGGRTVVIDVTAKAIQTANINNGSTAPADVLSILNNNLK